MKIRPRPVYLLLRFLCLYSMKYQKGDTIFYLYFPINRRLTTFLPLSMSVWFTETLGDSSPSQSTQGYLLST